ncbi:unnamed protein product [Darwinula stevensoni]|uniref:Uncharacterized protein n=1 Tax=Darwinula stevensoni TaxID=69355 RepID=A0A7R8X0W5_9CRUS|nr:unnamed protein product [Darwinula stevensoni]CAG0882155.1 unnamed protein product [Darwinula stevensoni]
MEPGSMDLGGGCTNAKEFCGQYNREPGGMTYPMSHLQCGSCLDGYTEEEWTGGRVAEVCRPTGSSDRTQDDLAPGETSQGTELTVIVASIVVGVCCVLILVGVWFGFKKRRKKPKRTDVESNGQSARAPTFPDTWSSTSSFLFQGMSHPVPVRDGPQQLDVGMEALENRKGSEIAQEETPLVVHGFISGDPERLLKAQPEDWEEYQSNPCSAYNNVSRVGNGNESITPLALSTNVSSMSTTRPTPFPPSSSLSSSPSPSIRSPSAPSPSTPTSSPSPPGSAGREREFGRQWRSTTSERHIQETESLLFLSLITRSCSSRFRRQETSQHP